ncbi:hypothetical protein Tco_0261495, partial [Tanacetum coccineum]
QHERPMHIEIDIHFVQDLDVARQVRVLHVPSRYQYTDIFTKGFPSALFEEFRTILSIRCPPAQWADEIEPRNIFRNIFQKLTSTTQLEWRMRTGRVRERKEAEESFTLTLELRLFFFIKLHAGTEIVLLYKVAFETRVKVHELRGKSKADLFAQLKDLKAKLALLCVAKMNVEMLQKMAGVVSTIKKGGGSHDVIWI